MDDRLSLTQIGLLSGYAVAMAAGQLLFKLSAVRNSPRGGFGQQILALAWNKYFLAAVLLYGALTVLWVWILSFTPLSRAYVFVALAFGLTPLASSFMFGEPITGRLVVGIAFIFLGLICVTGLP